MGGNICHVGVLKGPKVLTGASYGCEKGEKRSGFVIYLYLKDEIYGS